MTIWKIDHLDGRRWPITPQQITVHVGQMLREAEASGTTRDVMIESIIIALGTYLVKTRREEKSIKIDQMLEQLKQENGR